MNKMSQAVKVKISIRPRYGFAENKEFLVEFLVRHGTLRLHTEAGDASTAG
jgi:hypothetical protein